MWANRWLGPLARELRPIAAPLRRWGYRRKALLHAQFLSGTWHFGLLRRRGREAELIPIPDCPLHAPELNLVFRALRELAPPEVPLAFVQISGKALTIVLKCHAESRWRDWATATEAQLRQAGVESLHINWNPSAGRRPISSRHQELIFGDEFLHDGEAHYGALSFRQQIPELETSALALAEGFLSSFGKTAIVDLYCGSGATMARWRRRGWKTVGVELSGEALRAAALNAPGAELLRGKAEQRIPQLSQLMAEHTDGFVIYTNPPRDGQAAEVTEWQLASRPSAIAYLSCNPRSLARDLELLQREYVVETAQPFDFFPQTDHVETLALLSRKHS